MNTFQGFGVPEENWSKLPNAIIYELPRFGSLAELAVVLYILRHTWGYQQFGPPVKLSLDELCTGRFLKGKQVDDGTGLSRPTVIRGLLAAKKDGFINIDKRRGEKGHTEVFFSLQITEGESEEKRTHFKKLTPQQDMVRSLVLVCNKDANLPEVCGKYFKLAASLLKAGYVPQQIETVYGPGGWWWTAHWRGLSKKEYPNAATIVDTIKEALSSSQAAPSPNFKLRSSSNGSMN